MAVPGILVFVLCWLVQSLVIFGEEHQHETTGSILRRQAALRNLISDGTEAMYGQFPYMVFVLYKISDTKIDSCSASLIEPNVVLLAAHCLPGSSEPNPKDFIVVAGQANLKEYMATRESMSWEESVNDTIFDVQERRVIGAERHSEYVKNPENCYFYDVGLLRLENNGFTLSNNVQTITIADGKLSSPTSCTILGWGRDEKNRVTYHLKYAHNVIAKPMEIECNTTRGNFLVIDENGSGICKGDSGSPLVCGGLVYGVASHYFAHKNAICGDGFGGRYVHTSEVMPLIKNFLHIGSKKIVIPTGLDEADSSSINKSALLFISFQFFILLLTR